MPLISRRAILPHAVWLVWLIKGLKVEQVDTPVQHAADSALPVGDCVVRGRDGGAVVGATVGGPAGLTVPEFGDGDGAADRLDVVEGLHDVVEVSGGCVADFLGLPVGEGVDETGRGGRVSCAVVVEVATGVWGTHSSLTPPLMTGSAVPSAYLFQLSAVPIVVLGNIFWTSLIFSRSCSPVKLPRYSDSDPTVMA